LTLGTDVFADCDNLKKIFVAPSMEEKMVEYINPKSYGGKPKKKSKKNLKKKSQKKPKKKSQKKPKKKSQKKSQKKSSVKLIK